MEKTCPREEFWSSVTHGIGFILSLIGLYFLVEKGIDRTNPKHIIGGLVFGLSLGLCYFSSTVYHWAKSEKVKKALRCLDHAAIYILIAGTYTPYLLFCVGDEGQYFWLPIIWTIAAVGVVLKLFFTGRFNILSTIGYLSMGWLCLAFIGKLVTHLPTEGVVLLVAGGVTYSLGALVFMFEKIPFNHVIWHVFVMGGSIFHYLSVFLYVE